MPAPSAPRPPSSVRRRRAATPTPQAGVPVEIGGRPDTAYLETLLGYNARRAALSVIAVFLRRMEPFGLRPVDFSVLTLIAHNPGVTSRQICAALDVLPPNLVGLVKQLESRGLLVRKPHPSDRRAQGLHLSAEGKRVQRAAQVTATELEGDVAGVLSPQELLTLNTLLRKVYQREQATGATASG